jgi:hypothetical protein
MSAMGGVVFMIGYAIRYSIMQEADIAQALAAMGRQEEAQYILRRILSGPPEDAPVEWPRAAAALAMLLLPGGRIEEAVNLAEQAIAHAPHDPLLLALHRQIGMALYNGQFFEEALPWLERAAELEPWDTVLAAMPRRERPEDFSPPKIEGPATGQMPRRYNPSERASNRRVTPVRDAMAARAMSQPSTLDALGLKHGTDKASSYHNYLNVYEKFFAPLRNNQLTVLEIGVFNGASLRTWEEYFPKAKIIGVDIMPASRWHERNRVTIELADQSNVEHLTRLAMKHGPFDIIIEDGSHMWEHQITSLRTLFPFLKDGGIYIVEDLQTNYGSLQEQYKGVASSTCVEYLEKWLDLLVADDQTEISGVEDAFLRTYGRAVQFITFCRRACLLRKQFPPVVWAVDAGRSLVSGGEDRHSVAVSIIVHVTSKGDVVGPFGFVDLGSDASTFEGFLIDSNEDAFEYRVRLADESWSGWTQKGNFAGTRGRAMLVTGFTIRLLEGAKERYVLRAFGRFAGSGNPIEVSDGQDCLPVSGGALCGIQVVLATRVG